MICGDYFIYDNEICAAKEFKDPFMGDNLNIYEVVRIDNGIPLFFDDHLERLKTSFRIAGKEPFLSDSDIKSLTNKLIAANDVKEALIRIVFSFHKNGNAHILIFQNKVSFPTAADYKNGVSCLLQYSERENPSAKIYNQAVRGKANRMISSRHVYETILVNSAGKITEGSRSNIFFVKNDIIYTAPDDMVLQGITRQKVIVIITSLGTPFQYKAINVDNLKEMDAIFITGTTPKVLSVNQIDNIMLDVNNPLIKQVIQAYDIMIENYKK